MRNDSAGYVRFRKGPPILEEDPTTKATEEDQRLALDGKSQDHGLIPEGVLFQIVFARYQTQSLRDFVTVMGNTLAAVAMDISQQILVEHNFANHAFYSGRIVLIFFPVQCTFSELVRSLSHIIRLEYSTSYCRRSGTEVLFTSSRQCEQEKAHVP